jgi:hypothetical protein
MSAWRDKEEFKARVLEWADKLGVKASALYVRPMRRKWASCSTVGTLSFNVSFRHACMTSAERLGIVSCHLNNTRRTADEYRPGPYSW